MGSKPSPAPAPAPQQPVAAATPVEATKEDPGSRGAARRIDDPASGKASLLEPAAGDNLDPLTAKKSLSAGSASLMG